MGTGPDREDASWESGETWVSAVRRTWYHRGLLPRNSESLLLRPYKCALEEFEVGNARTERVLTEKQTCSLGARMTVLRYGPLRQLPLSEEVRSAGVTRSRRSHWHAAPTSAVHDHIASSFSNPILLNEALYMSPLFWYPKLHV